MKKRLGPPPPPAPEDAAEARNARVAAAFENRAGVVIVDHEMLQPLGVPAVVVVTLETGDFSGVK